MGSKKKWFGLAALGAVLAGLFRKKRRSAGDGASESPAETGEMST